MKIDTDYVIRLISGLKKTMEKMDEGTKEFMKSASSFKANFESDASKEAVELVQKITQTIGSINTIINESSEKVINGAKGIAEAENIAKGLIGRL